ncbi:hypothetical protein D3C76_1458030 [compost metagenome]
MAANKVGHQAAGFTHQQFTRGEIPWLQANFEETVHATGSHVGQIQCGRTGTTEVGTLGKQLANHVDVWRCVLLNFEREAGCQDGAIQVFGVGAAQTVTVELCALTAGSGEQFVTHWIVNHSDFGTAFNAYSDRD